MTIFYIFKKWKIGYRHGDICAIVKIRERRLMKTFSCWVFSCGWVICINPDQDMKLHGQGDTKEPEEWEESCGKWHLDMTGTLQALLTDAMVTQTRSIKSPARMKWGLQDNALCLTAIDSTWPLMQGKSLSFGDMVVVGCSCPSEGPHSYVHMGSTNWAQELINSKK